MGITIQQIFLIFLLGIVWGGFILFTMRKKEPVNDYGKKYFQKLTSDINNPVFLEQQSLIMKFLPPKDGDRILDLGCGRGIAGLFALSKAYCHVTFSDISDESIGLPNFVQCSMESTPFKDNDFNKIYSLSTISHLDNPEDAVREMARIADTVFITTNNKYCVWVRKIAAFLRIIPEFRYDKTVRKLYTQKSLITLFSKNGWSVKTYYWGDFCSKKLPFEFLKTKLMLVGIKNPPSVGES